ncbi:hypothetical protein LCGC14_1114240 [marine sediment metagenome]|uniref:Uncharacterized protein n=2 Tax=root TaxID=1 RepID=A0A831QT95_9FLAO|nr:hypothetical protein [Pricia sp.]HEA22739.1 hypothetical protein [Pricia antarctica]
MKYLKYIYPAVIAILLVILFVRKTETVTITVPEKTGQFDRNSTELKPIIQYDTIVSEGKKEVIEVPNPVNLDLLKKYHTAQDSLERLKLYKDAVTERTYKETYRDSTQEITVTSEVIGTLKGQKIDYKVFPQTIEVQQKKPKISLYGGIRTTVQPQQNFEPHFTLRSPKALYSVGYNINQKAVTVGLSYKLF